MIFRRTDDGALKWALRHFRLEDDTLGLNFMAFFYFIADEGRSRR